VPAGRSRADHPVVIIKTLHLLLYWEGEAHMFSSGHLGQQFTVEIVKSFVQVSYLPNHRPAGAPSRNIQSKLPIAPDVCKNASLALLFGSNGNSYTISRQTDMCI
jgi:hypothetical protein